MRPLTDDTLPRRLAGRYKLLRRIGASSRGLVYGAKNVRSGKAVAVKMLHFDTGGEEDVMQQFLRGARNAARIIHPSSVSVLDVDRGDDGHLFIVEELLEADDLEDHVVPGRRLGTKETVALILPVSDALAMAHACGLAHRDVRPGNIMLAHGPEGEAIPMLADLGGSAALEALTPQLTATGLLLGTPAYMAPEQVTGDAPSGPPADVWALGVMTYQLLKGELPFEGKSVYTTMDAVAQGPLPRLHGTLGVPDAVADVVAEAMVREPAERIGTAQEFGRRLQAAVEGKASDPVPRDPAAEARRAAGAARWQAAAEAGPVEAYVLETPRLQREPLVPLRFGIAATVDDRHDDALSAALSATFGIGTVALRFRRYEALVRALSEGRIELAWLPPVAVARARRYADLELLAMVERERTTYASALVAREGTVASLGELEGRRAAWVDPWSSSGYHWPRQLLRQAGYDPRSFFSEELFLGSHDAVLDAVESGEADVGGTFCPVDDAGVPVDPPWLRRSAAPEPGVSTPPPPLEALAVSERVPPDAIAAGPNAPEALVARLASALHGADGTQPAVAPLFARLDASGFVAPDSARYGPERGA
ncbi:MAG: serine/threonine-protein kinase [Myxococcota bacterium]